MTLCDSFLVCCCNIFLGSRLHSVPCFRDIEKEKNLNAASIKQIGLFSDVVTIPKCQFP